MPDRHVDTVILFWLCCTLSTTKLIIILSLLLLNLSMLDNTHWIIILFSIQCYCHAAVWMPYFGALKKNKCWFSIIQADKAMFDAFFFHTVFDDLTLQKHFLTFTKNSMTSGASRTLRVIMLLTCLQCQNKNCIQRNCCSHTHTANMS